MNLDVICLGEVLVDFISTEPGVSVSEAPAFIKAQGGAMANVAVGLARLGVKSGFLGKVGRDEFGRFLEHGLRENKVDTTMLYFSESYPTGLVFVALDKARKPSFCFFGKPSADMMLKPEEVRPEFFEHVRFLHIATVSIVQEPAREATFRAVELAREKGVPVSFDPNFRLHLWQDQALLKSLTGELARQSNLVKLSQEELNFLLGESEIESACARLLEMGPQAVVVTMGEHGAYYATAEGRGKDSGFKVKTVDTTGAGDAFMAGILAELLEKKTWPPSPDDLAHAVRFANATAALSTLKPGAVAALPDLNRVREFIRSPS